jgi:hypothetical protein
MSLIVGAPHIENEIGTSTGSHVMSSTTRLVHHRRFVRAARTWAALNTAMLLGFAAPTIVVLGVGTVELARGRDPSLVPALALLGLLALRFWRALAAVRKGKAEVRGPESDSERHWYVAAWRLRWAIGRNLVLGVGALAFTSCAIALAGRRADGLAVFAGVWDALFLFILVVDSFSTSSVLRHVSVVPYFQSRVGEIETFGNGRHLARAMNGLDDRARSLGVVPLSAFGWNDDLAGESLVWHAPDDGLKTVDALLAEEQLEPGVRDDLERIAHALRRAADKRIRFCLLLRHGDVTSGAEWDVRQGTCF